MNIIYRNWNILGSYEYLINDIITYELDLVLINSQILNFFFRSGHGGFPLNHQPEDLSCEQKVTEFTDQFAVQIKDLNKENNKIKSDIALLKSEHLQLKSDLASAQLSDQMEKVLKTRTKRELNQVS